MDGECAFYPNLQQFPGERQLFPALSRWAPCPARPKRSLQAGCTPPRPTCPSQAQQD